MRWLKGVTFPPSEVVRMDLHARVVPGFQQADRCIVVDEDVFAVQTKWTLRLLSYSYVCLPQNPS